jgi:hypothetical protein
MQRFLGHPRTGPYRLAGYAALHIEQRELACHDTVYFLAFHEGLSRLGPSWMVREVYLDFGPHWD